MRLKKMTNENRPESTSFFYWSKILKGVLKLVTCENRSRGVNTPAFFYGGK